MSYAIDKLVVLELEWEKLVKELLGRRFLVADTTYAVVDVRNVDGETFVYAELTADTAEAEHTIEVDAAKGPGRAAFRYIDIEQQLNDTQMGCASGA